MALIQVDYFSKALLRQVHFQAILPFDKVYFDDVVREQNPSRLCICCMVCLAMRPIGSMGQGSFVGRKIEIWL